MRLLITHTFHVGGWENQKNKGFDMSPCKDEIVKVIILGSRDTKM